MESFALLHDWILQRYSDQGILKRELGLLLVPVAAILTFTYGGELCTFRFGTSIRCDMRTLLLPCDSLRDNLYACVFTSRRGKASRAGLKGLTTKNPVVQ